jgi:hypothetical protein
MAKRPGPAFQGEFYASKYSSIVYGDHGARTKGCPRAATEGPAPVVGIVFQLEGEISEGI